MEHRYIVWEGHRNRRRFTEMHILNSSDAPICALDRPHGTAYETIHNERPARYPLCRLCGAKRVAFEEAEKLRTWKELAS